MENASKALIIAGAILLAILLITAGIVVIRAIDPVNQQAKDSAETMAIESYNAQFIKYEGEKMSGAQVKALISTVRSSNAVHENELKITYVDSETGETISDDLLSSETKIIPNGKYDVTITEWSDGYITAMTVSGVKGVITTQPIVPGDETPVNNPPTVTAIVENITTTTAKIVATGTDADEADTLTYNFYILNTEKNKEETTEETWNVTGLSPNTKYDYKVEVTDGKITRGTTGNFTTLEETPINNAPTINPNVTKIETNSVTINANGNDIDGDTLTYVLYIAGNKYGESQTGKWDVTGLNSNTAYEYKVTVTDGKISEPVEKTSQFTTKKENTAPTVTATVSDIYCTLATIKATGSDIDGDTLEYTLLIDGIEQNIEGNGPWTLTGLTRNKGYNYEVQVTDGKATTSASGTFTTDNITVQICKATNITTNSATIVIQAKSDQGHELEHYIDFNSVGRVASGTEIEIPLKNLESNHYYNYTIYTDYAKGISTESRTDSYIKFGTNCPGDTYSCEGYSSYECTSGTYCSGTHEEPCDGTITRHDTVVNGYCSSCGYNTWQEAYYTCNKCSVYGTSAGCTNCDVGESTDIHKYCTMTVEGCEHGYSSGHYVHDGCGCYDGWYYDSCGHGYYGTHYFCDHSYEGVEHPYTK